jgi:hypothetical protein
MEVPCMLYLSLSRESDTSFSTSDFFTNQFLLALSSFFEIHGDICNFVSIIGEPHCMAISCSTVLCRSQNFMFTRALLSLLRKCLGLSKPATLP